MYRLNFLDIPNVQALVFSRPDWAQVRVGAQFVALDSNSGGDNLFVTNNTAIGFAETPEPSTWVVVATGVGGLLLRRLRAARGTSTRPALLP